jgi:hypothetical protein
MEDNAAKMWSIENINTTEENLAYTKDLSSF